MTLSSKPLAVTILVLLFGGILLSSAMGWWQTESSKLAAMIGEGEFAGQPDPADIRGSYTFGDVEKNFDVPTGVLAEAFGIPAVDPSAFSVKDLETLYADGEFEIGTASVRLFVALYTGLPYEIIEEVYLPERAVEILNSHATLTAEQDSYLDAHAVIPPSTGNAQAGSQPDSNSQTETHTETESTDRTLKGKTTFQEVLDWGVPQATIEGVIGGPMPNSLTKAKDYCAEKGLSFEEIKPALQAEIDKVK
jgi:hypothetical protein